MNSLTNNNFQTPFDEEYKRVIGAKEIVTRYLSGESEAHCYDQEPSRRYCIGIITPLTEDETSLTEEKQKWILKRRPNSIGFEARIVPENSELRFRINITFSLYYRSIPSFREQKDSVNLAEGRDISSDDTKVRLRQKFTRVDVVLEDIDFPVMLPHARHFVELDCQKITDQINLKLSALADEIVTKSDCWIAEQKEPTIPLSTLQTEEKYKASIPSGESEKPTWQAKMSIRLWPSGGKDWRVGVLLSNETDPSKSQHQSSFFNTKVSCKIEKASFTSVPFKAAVLDYRYNTQSWGKGINCVLSVENSTAVTETVPIFHQPRTVSRANMDTACNFGKLSTDEYAETLENVGRWLHEYAEQWDQENQSHTTDINFSSREKSLDDFRQEIKRFEFGIESLKKDDRLSYSFRHMNEVFSKGEHKNWRLFQLVFIVSEMPSLLAREKPEPKYLGELNKVDVLWFPTGGGKTEAYFGVIVTAMFYDRLRGKKRGVTAWLRYPLRMLSIQQLQRLVDIVVQAENVRLSSSNDELIKSDPFTVGYYVGSSNTPNELTFPPAFRTQDPIAKYKEEVDKTSNVNDLKLLVLQRCPHCKSTNLGIDIDIKKIRIRHVCKNCTKVAPIFISDSEIYRYAPSIIVGTVDRLAMAGRSGLFSHIFGSFTHRCPEHGYLSFGQCVEAACKVSKKLYEKLPAPYDPTPALLLQDELHLLKESLGTYDSHYESFLDLLSSKTGNGLPSKHLAATATIEGYKEHIWELYGRDAIRFPVKGKGEFDSAYVQPSVTERYSRLYVGIMPTGTNTEETVSTILKTLKMYSAESAKSDQWSDSITNNYDLGLAYVNEKNTAGNIRARWDEVSDVHHDIQVLTGDKGLGEVRSVISRVESDPGKDYESRLRALVATSIISHGVDLSRLNYMAFCGMPNHASDYIQASSRVGRSHFGVVFTVFRPDNNRERNIYQRFYEYHERLYQLVQPVPINRFSESSIKRTITGILGACILNIVAYQKSKRLESARDFVAALESGEIADEELIELVKSSYLVDAMNLPGTAVDFFNRLISRLVKDQRRVIKEGTGYRTIMRMRPTPVSSLREVSEQVEFSVAPWSYDMLVKIIEGKKNNYGKP